MKKMVLPRTLQQLEMEEIPRQCYDCELCGAGSENDIVLEVILSGNDYGPYLDSLPYHATAPEYNDIDSELNGEILIAKEGTYTILDRHGLIKFKEIPEGFPDTVFGPLFHGYHSRKDNEYLTFDIDEYYYNEHCGHIGGEETEWFNYGECENPRETAGRSIPDPFVSVKVWCSSCYKIREHTKMTRKQKKRYLLSKLKKIRLRISEREIALQSSQKRKDELKDEIRKNTRRDDILFFYLKRARINITEAKHHLLYEKRKETKILDDLKYLKSLDNIFKY